MQTDHPLVDDLSKFAQGLMTTLDSMKKECDAMVRARIERLASEFELVPRDDFDALKELVLKLRAENEDLKKRLGKLETSPKNASRK
jgi:BMFP domain-containing protein YqiC